MLSVFIHLWNLPYLRWYFVLVILPSVILWSVWGRYLIKYWQVFIIITVGAFIWGLPLDMLSVPVSHIYGFHPTQNLGVQFLGLPLEEYFFFLFVPQEAIAVILLVRRVLYG